MVYPTWPYVYRFVLFTSNSICLALGYCYPVFSPFMSSKKLIFKQYPTNNTMIGVSFYPWFDYEPLSIRFPSWTRNDNIRRVDLKTEYFYDKNIISTVRWDILHSYYVILISIHVLLFVNNNLLFFHKIYLELFVALI